MLLGSVCIDTLVWKRTRRAQLAKVLGSLCQLGTSVHMQNQFSQPVTVASQEQLQLLVQPPEASHGLSLLAEQLEHLFDLGLKKPAVGGGCCLPQSCQLSQILLLIIAKRSASKILHALPLWQFAKLFGCTVPVRLRRWPKRPESYL